MWGWMRFGGGFGSAVSLLPVVALCSGVSCRAGGKPGAFEHWGDVD